MSKRRKLKNWQKVIATLTIILLVAVGYLGYEVYRFLGVIHGNPNDEFEWDEIEKIKVPPKDDSSNRLNVLLLGVDARTPNEPSRTDTIIILSMDKIEKDAALLSIPRDTRVNIPGRGMDKINHAHAFGGVALSIEAVEEFLDIPIHYYARLNFEGFKDIVDALGGVTIDVEPQVARERPTLTGMVGVHKLNGEQALDYVRFRKDREGDIGRVKRQQKFIRAIAKESLQLSTVLKAPTLLNRVGENLRTNVPTIESVALGRLLLEVDLDKAPTAMIPGRGEYINRISYWIPDLEETEEVLVELGLREDDVSASAMKP